MQIQQKTGFIGAGQMAQALARGFVDKGLLKPEQIYAADPAQQTLDAFTSQIPGANVSTRNADVVANTDILFVAVKPQYLPDVVKEIGGSVTEKQLLISIVAGVKLADLAAFQTPRIIRVMPNTPCLVGVGAAGFCLADGVTDEDADIARSLLEATGVVFQLRETQIDAVTGLSGSAPAYIYMLIEALSDGGVRVGLPRAVATTLATQTVLGAATMVQQTGEHPAVLKDRVASPGGTTIAGIEALEQGAFRAAIIAAVTAATDRSIELGEDG